MHPLKAFIKNFFFFSPVKNIMAVFIMVMTGLLEGVGLLLLEPLLKFTHLSSSLPQVNTAQHSSKFAFIFQFIANLHLSLLQVLSIYVFLVACISILSYLNAQFSNYIQLNYAYELRQKLYKTFMNATWHQITQFKQTRMNHLLTQAVEQVSFGASMLLQLLSNSVLTIVYLLTAVFLSFPLTLIALLCGGFMFIALHFQTRLAYKFGKGSHAAFRQLYETVGNHLNSIKLAKVYGMEKQFQDSFTKIDRNIIKLKRNLVKLKSSNRLFYFVGGALSFSVVFYFAVTTFHTNLITLFILLVIFARIIPKLSSFHQNYQSLLNSLPNYTAIVEVLATYKKHSNDRQNTQLLTTIPFQREIQFKKLFYAYPGHEQQVLSDISFSIKPNQVTAIVGHSGAGKSTLIDLLVGLLEPVEGEILIDGKPLTAYPKKAWQNLIAYVPQSDFLFHDTIRANLCWTVSSATEDQMWQVLEMVGAKDFVTKLPKQLETILGDNGVNLSGGEKQRIILAQALLRSPKLLILDEATNALDIETEAIIFDSLKRLKGELTIIIVSHRTSTIQWIDQVIMLEKGQMMAQGVCSKEVLAI